MHHRPTPGVRLAAAMTLALAAAGCSDDLTSPAGRGPAAPGDARLNASTSGVTLHSNTAKYRDAGGKPGTGRSGSARLTALALLGRDGVTTLELTSGRADTVPGAAGTIEKVQVKGFGSGGAQLFTRNFDGTAGPRFGTALGGLARGDRLETQANVSGIDAGRTDVVVANETVKLRPDLAVFLDLPERALAGHPLNVVAVVGEMNGDVGARADCALYADGVRIDRAQGVWVDAGDAVTCAFTAVFGQPGTVRLEARVETVRPLDYDPSNNAAAATMEVVSQAAAYYDAFASSDSSVTVNASSATWINRGDGSNGASRDSSHVTTVWQRGQLYGWLTLPVPSPYTVRVAQSTGDRTLHAEEYASADGFEGPGYSCVEDYDYSGQVFFSSCSFDDPYQGRQTSFRYERFAGSVTYHADGFSRFWDALQGTESVYHYNYTSPGTSGGPIVPFGPTYRFEVVYTSGDGTWSVTPELQMRTDVFDSPFQRQCSVFDNEWYVSDSCFGWSHFIHSTFGREWKNPYF